MHRPQISLEPEHYSFLSAEARRQGVSMAEVVRRLVEDRMRVAQQRDPFVDLVGAGEGDGSFSGADYDRVLYGDPGECPASSSTAALGTRCSTVAIRST